MMCFRHKKRAGKARGKVSSLSPFSGGEILFFALLQVDISILDNRGLAADIE